MGFWLWGFGKVSIHAFPIYVIASIEFCQRKQNPFELSSACTNTHKGDRFPTRTLENIAYRGSFFIIPKNERYAHNCVCISLITTAYLCFLSHVGILVATALVADADVQFCSVDVSAASGVTHATDRLLGLLRF